MACGMAACGSVIMTAHPPLESRGLKPGAKFRVVATIAANGSNDAIRVSRHVRERLNAAGIPAVASGGRWERQYEAIREICQRTDVLVDGVVIVDVTVLALIDCENGLTAYTVSGQTGSPGIDVLTDRLIAFLNEGPEGPPQTFGTERPIS
ncbi:MAG TPA: hypothetical protein VLV45_02240 [Gemmatimonadales bacterium]|nr:hypothetical protein [Gemmatimonadales bacterium]